MFFCLAVLVGKKGRVGGDNKAARLCCPLCPPPGKCARNAAHGGGGWAAMP